MADWGSVIDRLIREAQERGEFDNLAGKGQRLKLEDNALEDPERRLANRVLKNAGFAPDWIELDKDVRQGLDEARQALRRSRAWCDERLARLGDRRDAEAQRERNFLAGEWQRAQARFVETIGEINRQIDVLNLKVPLLNLQRLRLDAGRELIRLESEAPE
jgi:hypothetical protein